MTEPKATNPHNNLFVQTLSQPQEARSLIEHHFPKQVVAVLNLDTLELENDSFVDPVARELLRSVVLGSAPVKASSFRLLAVRAQERPRSDDRLSTAAICGSHLGKAITRWPATLAHIPLSCLPRRNAWECTGQYCGIGAKS